MSRNKREGFYVGKYATYLLDTKHHRSKHFSASLKAYVKRQNKLLR